MYSLQHLALRIYDRSISTGEFKDLRAAVTAAAERHVVTILHLFEKPAARIVPLMTREETAYLEDLKACVVYASSEDQISDTQYRAIMALVAKFTGDENPWVP